MAVSAVSHADVASLTANGQSPPPNITVNVGDPVTFEAEFDNCLALGPDYDGWYYRWDFDDDGTWDETTVLSAEDACSASPVTTTHTYTQPGRVDAVVEHGRIDWFWVFEWWPLEWAPNDSQSIRLQVRPGGGGGGLGGLEITHASATASTCAASGVTIEALNNGGNRRTNYTGTITVTTSSGHGNWTGNTTVNTVNNGTADDGEATYTFANADDGLIVLDLTNEHADNLTITVTDAAAGVSSSSDSDGNPQPFLSFRDNAFVIERDDPLGNDVIAGRDHGLRVALMRRDPGSGDCGVAQAYQGDIPLKGWVARDADDPGGAAPQLDDPNHPAAILPDGRPGSNNLTLRFVNGVAVPDLVTTDVGRYAVNLADDTSGFAVDANGNPREIGGGSVPMTVRPFAFAFDFSSDPDGAGAHAESGGVPDPDGSPFKAAGEGFTLRLRTVLWQSADDDGPEDGVPDGDADLSDNASAPAFGAEGTAETVDLAHAPSLAGMDEAGVLSVASGGAPIGLGGFSGGEASHDLAYDEVGIIDLSAGLSDGDYLLSGRDVTGQTDNVGRFHPDAFDVAVNQPFFDAACTGFTYLGQPYVYVVAPEVTITALNAGGQRTRNYEDGFWRLGTALQHDPAASSGFVYADLVGTAALTYPTSAVGYGDTSDVDGQVLVYMHDAAGDEFIYQKPAGEVAPFDADVELQIGLDDGDATGSGTIEHIGFTADSDPPDDLAATADELLRYGRFDVGNAHGSEMLPLEMPLMAEYFDGDGYVVNAADDCTAYTATSVTLENFGGDLTAADVEAYGNGTLVNGRAEPSNPLIIGGTGGPTTGPEVSGAVDVVLAAPPYLRFDWDPAAAGEEDPRGRATFGIYRGSDNVIYQRELY